MSEQRQFAIENWAAWAPGLESAGQWQAFFDAPQALADDERADVAFMPAMQRRRLSPLARAAFYVGHRCMEGRAPCPAVYSSIYGETRRSQTILQGIARHEDMSPTAFGLSVHNAIAGQASIFFGNTEPMIALAPSDQSYLTAFVDALGFLREGKSSVLVVFYEEPAPAFFAPSCAQSPDFTCALALHISKPRLGSELYQLDFPANSQAPASDLPDLLRLIRLFVDQDRQLSLGNWQLTAC